MERIDALGKLRKDARKIADALAKNDGSLSITIAGALHEGNPSTDILNAASDTTITTLELPSISVNSYLLRQESRVSKEGFWAQVIDASPKSSGVNNNRAAVNAIRILDDRVRLGQSGIPDSFPDVSISRHSSQDFTLEEITDATLIDSIRDQEEGFENIYPSPTFVLHEGQEHYIHVNRPTGGKKSLSAVTVGGNYMLPTQYYMTNGDKLFGETMGGIAGAELTEFALSHFLRTKVDRTQVQGMLKSVKTQLSQKDKKETHLLHVGGAAHNPNLLAILNEIFSPYENVTICQLLDTRMPSEATDKLTLFGKYIPIQDSLSATKTYQDQVAIHTDTADKLLANVISTQKDELVIFGRREQIARDFEDKVEHDNSGQVEYFTTRSLLSLIPPELCVGIEIDKSFPYKLADIVMTSDPSVKDKVDYIMQRYENRKINFPLRA